MPYFTLSRFLSGKYCPKRLPSWSGSSRAACEKIAPGVFQQMEEVRIALEELKQESDSGRVFRAAPAEPRPRNARAVPIVASLVGTLALIVAVWLLGRSKVVAPPLSLTRLTSDSGFTGELAISPDGKLIAYASDRAGSDNLDIWVQNVSGGDANRLTTEAGDEREPAFSRDGSRIVFRSDKAGGGIYALLSPVTRKSTS